MSKGSSLNDVGKLVDRVETSTMTDMRLRVEAW